MALLERRQRSVQINTGYILEMPYLQTITIEHRVV